MAKPRAAARNPVGDQTNILGQLLDLLDRATRAEHAAKYFWGLVAAGVAITFISNTTGLNRTSFVAMVAAFIAVAIYFAFSRVERSQNIVVRGAGYAVLTVSVLAFVFVIAMSAWLALTCGPRLIAHLYGVTEVCELYAAKPDPALPNSAKQLRAW